MSFTIKSLSHLGSSQQEELGAATPSVSIAQTETLKQKEASTAVGEISVEGAGLSYSLSSKPKAVALHSQVTVPRTPLYNNALVKALTGVEKQLGDAPSKKRKRNRTSVEEEIEESLSDNPTTVKELFSSNQESNLSPLGPVPNPTPASKQIPLSLATISVPLEIPHAASPLLCPRQQQSSEQKMSRNVFPGSNVFSEGNSLDVAGLPANYWENDEELKFALLQDEKDAAALSPVNFSSEIPTFFQTARGVPVTLTDPSALMFGLKSYFETSKSEVEGTDTSDPFLDLAGTMLNQQPIHEGLNEASVDASVAGSHLIEVLPYSRMKKSRSADLIESTVDSRHQVQPADVGSSLDIALPSGDILFIPTPHCSQ